MDSLLILLLAFVVLPGIMVLCIFLEDKEPKKNNVKKKQIIKGKEIQEGEECTNKEWQDKFAKVRSTSLYKDILLSSREYIESDLETAWRQSCCSWSEVSIEDSSYVRIDIGEKECEIRCRHHSPSSYCIKYEKKHPYSLNSEEQYIFSKALVYDLRELYSCAGLLKLSIDYYSNSRHIGVSFFDVYRRIRDYRREFGKIPEYDPPANLKREKVRATRLYDSILSNSCIVINREIKRVPLKIEKLPPSRWRSCIHISFEEEKCLIKNQYKPSDSVTVEYKDYGVRFLYSEERHNFYDILIHDLKEKYPDLTVERPSVIYNSNYNFYVSFEKIYEKYKPESRF